MKRRLIRPLALAVAVALLGEVACAAGIALDRRRRLDVPLARTLERFAVTAWASGIFSDRAAERARAARIAPYLPGRRYLGELQKNSAAWAEFFAPEPLLGYRLGPNLVTVVRDSVYVTNAQGFVSTGETSFAYAKPKPAGVFRVIVVGGSAVLGEGAPTPDANLPARLREHLRGRHAGLEVINAGVGGYVSGQELLRVASELLGYAPDLLVVYDGWNDQYYYDVMERLVPDVDADALKAPVHYEMHTRLVRSYTVPGSLRTFLGMVKANLVLALERLASFTALASAVSSGRDALLGPAPGPSPPPAAGDEPPAAARIYARNVRSLIGLTAAHSVKIAVMLQPIMGVDGKTLTTDEAARAATITDAEGRRRFYRHARALYASLRRDSERRGAVCIEDLSQVVRDVSETVYADSGHMNPRGNDVVAAAMVRALDRCELLPRAP